MRDIDCELALSRYKSGVERIGVPFSIGNTVISIGMDVDRLRTTTERLNFSTTYRS
jgi:hypothetical protein